MLVVFSSAAVRVIDAVRFHLDPGFRFRPAALVRQPGARRQIVTRSREIRHRAVIVAIREQRRPIQTSSFCVV